MPAGGVKVRISEEGARALEQKIAKIDQRLEKLGKQSAKSGKLMKSAFGSIKGALAGAQLGSEVKKFMDYSKVLGYIQIRSKKTNAEMRGMEAEIINASNAIGVSKDELAQAAKTLQDNGGWTDTLTGQYEKFAATLKVTGGDAASMANALAAMRASGMSASEAVDELYTNIVGADVGTVANWSEAIGELRPALASVGIVGKRATEQFNIGLQTVGASLNGNVKTSTTALTSLLVELSKKGKALKKSKYKLTVFDKKGVMRDLDDIMADLYKKTGGKAQIIDTVFGGPAATAVKAFMQSIRQGKQGVASRVREAVTNAGGGGGARAEFKQMLEGVGGAALKADQNLNKMNNAVQAAMKMFTALSPELASLTSAMSENTAATLIAYDLMKGFGGLLKGGFSGIRGKGFGAGIGGKMGMLGKIGAVGAAAGVGVAVGTYLDKKFKISDKISNKLVSASGKKEAFRAKLNAGDKALEMKLAEEAVMRFSAMHRRGKRKLGTQELTAQTAAQVAAKQQGITDPKVIELLTKIANQEMKVTVQQSGVDKITAKGKRQQQ